MNWLALLGIIVVAYGLFCMYVAIGKPNKVWSMQKIQNFQKALGVIGAQILFAVFALALIGLGIWLIVK